MFADVVLVTMVLIGSLAAVGVCVWLCYRASWVGPIEQRRDTARNPSAPESTATRHRCWAWLVFCESDERSLVLDAVVDESDDAAVPPGLPFSIRVARPSRAERWVPTKLKLFAEQECLVLFELHGSPTGAEARLLAGDLALVFRLEQANGWPLFGPPRPSQHNRT